MKIFQQQKKAMPGWGYWGNYGEIDMGFSSGLIEHPEDYSGEQNQNKSHWVIWLLTGLIVLFVLRFVPVLNVILSIFVMLIGVGVLANTKLEVYKDLRKKNLL